MGGAWRRRAGPSASYSGKVKLAGRQGGGGHHLWDAARRHLKDYDLDTVAQITGADMADRAAGEGHLGDDEGRPGRGHPRRRGDQPLVPRHADQPRPVPAAHAHRPAGKPGAGCYTWAGNYKARLPGLAGDRRLPRLGRRGPVRPNLDPADGKDVKVNKTTKDEEPAYWNHGERPLIVNTPKYGRRSFTGQTHMPTPTKFLWFANVNLFNNAKHAYDMLFVVNPKIDCIIAQDVRDDQLLRVRRPGLPGQHLDGVPDLEITARAPTRTSTSGSGGILPVHDSRDDVHILAEAEALAKETGEPAVADYWKFILDDKRTA